MLTQIVNDLNGPDGPFVAFVLILIGGLVLISGITILASLVGTFKRRRAQRQPVILRRFYAAEKILREDLETTADDERITAALLEAYPNAPLAKIDRAVRLSRRSEV